MAEQGADSAPVDPLKEMAAKWKMRVSHGATLRSHQTNGSLDGPASNERPVDPAKEMMVKWKLKEKLSATSDNEANRQRQKFSNHGNRWLDVRTRVRGRGRELGDVRAWSASCYVGARSCQLLSVSSY